MALNYYVSTPSRICLFGENQDYLGLEVIAAAIDLRFSARISKRNDSIVHISIKDAKIDTLGMKNHDNLYSEFEIDITKPIVYESNRDYMKSCINSLLKNGYELTGFDIKMDSNIPIGKGMCSSSTMVVVLIKAILEAIQHPDKDDPEKIALLGFNAEVAEFGEPGGMMDHYTSALGGFVNLLFPEGQTIINRLNNELEGCFILFDSKAQKNTTQVLASAKVPTMEAIEQLGHGVKDFVEDESKMSLLENLDEKHKMALNANINNYKILLEAKKMLSEETIDPVKLGLLIFEHHSNLRDGLHLSTDTIDIILDTAMANGAYGGKINGSGGGGCCFVYARNEDADRIIQAVKELGYPGQILHLDTGSRLDKVED
jgi:galactokinase